MHENTLSERYTSKIKILDELLTLIKPIGSRGKKVVMCHGVFDIIHPGHIRHLCYAKSKADILVASITADRFINKGKYQPHVPQQLRAFNLAVFDFVDYVLIDEHQKPLQTLSTLQPDYFAKGYEYVRDGLHVKTSEEQTVVQAYGGEVIFTPGDIVYSSSHLQKTHKPDLKYEKLMNVMKTHGLTFSDLKETMQMFNKVKVHVVGDTIVDSITRSTMIGGQTKKPTVSVAFQDRDDFIGGAAIVAQHLKAAGAEVTFSTLLGDDELKDFVLERLHADAIHVNTIIDKGRPTTHKNAIYAEGQQLLKIDTVDNTSIDDKSLLEFSDAIKSVTCDAVIFSDFRHGIFNKRTIPTLIESIPKQCFKVADSQVASRWGNITQFQGFDLITPNEREARFALADQDSGIRPLSSELYTSARCKTLMLTLGERGMLTLINDKHESSDSYFVLESLAETITDPIGSGDALLAYATLSLWVNPNPVIASIIGSIAAACECAYVGNKPVTTHDVLAYLKKVISHSNYSEAKETKQMEPA